jgi:hypothetical protein
MTILLAALENSLLVMESSNDGWKILEHLGFHPTSVANDPKNSSRAYCGTLNKGLWKTDDNGQIWNQTKTNIPSNANIMSLSTSYIEKGEKGYNNVLVGTEPSGLYISRDGGEYWQIKKQFYQFKIILLLVISSKTMDSSCSMD